MPGRTQILNISHASCIARQPLIDQQLRTLRPQTGFWRAAAGTLPGYDALEVTSEIMRLEPVNIVWRHVAHVVSGVACCLVRVGHVTGAVCDM